MSKRKVKKSCQSPKTKSQKRNGIQDVSYDELQRIVEKAKTGGLNDDEFEKLSGAIDTLADVTQKLEKKGMTISRLRKMLFGATTEKMSNLFDDAQRDDDDKKTDGGSDSEDSGDTDKNPTAESDLPKKDSEEKEKRKGHGRKGADDYTGAKRVCIPHESLKTGEVCPLCGKGKLYLLKEPAVRVRVTGIAPLDATVYELERLRCKTCEAVFTAESPAGVGDDKYDISAAVMIALLKYGCGLPFNRLEKLQEMLGIPLPSSTQWDIAYQLAISLIAVYVELNRQAADGDVLYIDDTVAQILKLNVPIRKGKNGKDRTGIYTSGILSTRAGIEIALFFTGNYHAGENLEMLLSQRNSELSLPIQMCDGLLANTSMDVETILANCNSHARRNFVELVNKYKHETRHILDQFKLVYKNDDITQKQSMTDDERLTYHQTHSKPVMDELREWFDEQFESREIEPNSSLGEAITYATNRWKELTLFLRVPGAPIDNNACERVIKKAILHRKNSLFFKTQNGAYVADLFMSLIHTCELQKVNPFDYLVACAQNKSRVEENPAAWMPWNYKEKLQLSPNP
jgi:transposase